MLNRSLAYPKNIPIDWDQKLNKSVQNLIPSGIRAFFDIINTRKECISLGVGEPDFVSPLPILETAIAGLRKGYTHYAPNQGFASLRKEISDHLQREYDIFYDPEDEILITVGVSQGLDISLRSILEKGEGVLYSSPSYVSYSPLIEIAGGVPQKISLLFENKFQIKKKNIEENIDERSKAILLNYPANPTGASLDETTLKDISRLFIKNDLLVISDEIYADITYEKNGKHIPISTLPGMKERTVLLGGFSKSFAMTGWRIGYACGPSEWIKAMLKIHQYSMLCAPTVSQIAAEAAIQESIQQRDEMVAEYSSRKEIIVNYLNKMGLQCHDPQGAFYVFPSIRSTGMTSLEFAEKLLAKKDVAVVPGSAFGKEGEGCIRCSYATSEPELKEALYRMAEFLDELPKRINSK